MSKRKLAPRKYFSFFSLFFVLGILLVIQFIFCSNRKSFNINSEATSDKSPQPTRRALADVNRDGTVSQLDKSMVQASLGQSNPTGVSALKDVNQDRMVNGQDLALVVAWMEQTISSCETADINNDGIVGSADLEILSQYYSQEDNSTNMMADLNGDGIINIQDLSKAGGLFGCSWSVSLPLKKSK